MKSFLTAIFLLLAYEACAQDCPANQAPTTSEKAIADASASTQKSLPTTIDKAQTQQVTACLRTNAHSQLQAIDQLANQSHLYEVPINTHGDVWFDLGSPVVTQDFLTRQLERSQVLLGYAAPYLTLLQNTNASSDTRISNTSNTSYWINSINELNRYVQTRDRDGQVGSLEQLITSLAATSKADCKSWQARYQFPDLGNDLFSDARYKLQAVVKMSCR